MQLTSRKLATETRAWQGTRGESRMAVPARFEPAFRETATGRIELARFADGRVAPMHLIVGLPDDWAASRDADGRICSLRDGIEAGFVRDGVFFTREEAAAAD